MTEIAGQQVAEFVRGAFDFERTEAGVIPVRLPTRLARQVPDGITNEIFRGASGVRLELETEATAVELDVACYRGTVVGGLDLPEYPCVVDLVVDGSRVAEHTVEDPATRTFDVDGNLIGEERRTTTVRFAGLPDGSKTVELWLPHTAVVEVCALRADGPVRPRQDGRPRWLHYGSSISHCFEAPSPTRTWPAVAARLADVHLVSMGVAGSCFLDQFAARAIRDEPAEFISLKVGINVVNADAMKLRTFGPAVDGFLDTLREGRPDTPVLVVSPIVSPPHEDAPGPTIPLDADGAFVASAPPLDPANAPYALTLRRMRTILEEIVRARSADDPNLHYLDGLTLFGESDLDDLPDLLHPNGDGYARMGERFAATAFGPDGPFAR
jgi:hypothetical protein